jgi:hypothetical protein
MLQEEFRDIRGFPKYMVSDLGTIVNISTKRMMKPILNRNRGNYVVGLVGGGKSYVFQVDRIVADAFLDSPTETHRSLLHRDGDRANNAACNLVWMPRWFVVCYMREMTIPSMHKVKPFRSMDTGEIFETVAQFAAMSLSLPSRVQSALWRSSGTIHYFGKYGELRYL